MNIFQLKSSIFNDLKDPMSYLTDGPFVDNLVPDSVKVFGSVAYFYSNSFDWRQITTDCVLKKCSINDFLSSQHFCSFKMSDSDFDKLNRQLNICARIVYDQKAMNYVTNTFNTFDSFWKNIQKPNQTIHLSDFAYSKRGKKKQFVKIFDCHSQEQTGKMKPVTNCLVDIPIRWTLNVRGDDPDSMYCIFQPSLSFGIKILTMNGPKIIKHPWSFDGFITDRFKFPMFDSFLVRSPPLRIVSHFGPQFKADIDVKPEFRDAINALHSKLGCDPWDGVIHLNTSKSVHVGAFVISRLVAIRNKDSIHWQAQKIFLLPKTTTGNDTNLLETVEKKVGTKRDGDNKDNSPVSKTKRQCISNDTDDHTKE